ncbi:hypothetical protein CE91St41_26810 [Oscillospiraceae bacterium]|nr:hypothetical protein CE91St40_10730 [Oscillospiraceae bacterium]BDF75792.1 hypothetical protein CE91St41_26810 [Oscillospiraceae bacterium]
MKKRLLALALSLSLALGLCAPALATAEMHFVDVPTSHWAFDPIERAYSEGVMMGTGGDAAQHNGKFSPSDTLTAAQFAVILTRAFYPDKVNAQTTLDPWYAPAVAVGKEVGLFTNVSVKWDDPASINKPINRYNMAAMVNNILLDKGVPSLSSGKIWETSLGIPDYEDDAAFAYRVNMATVVYYGIITGTDSKGTFSGDQFVSRAQAATIYCRLADVLANNGATVTPSNPTETTKPSEPSNTTNPNETTEPSETTKPSGSSGAVGTISDETVTLSLSTHKPTTDYWSSAPADVKAITDKDMFNSAVQTYKDHNLIATEGTITRGTNYNYNYACYAADANATNQRMIESALNVMGYGYDGYGRRSGLSNADSPNVGIIRYNRNATEGAKYDTEFAPIFAKFSSGMSDKEKVSIMIDAMVDRFSYGDDEFTWLNGKTVGECKSYANSFQAICSAAGIPCIYYGADEVNHAWNLVYIDSTWYYVDVSGDPDPTFKLESEMRGNGVYSVITEDADYIKVAKAIIEAAC